MRKEEVRPSDGLSTLKMRVTRHECVDLLPTTGDHDLDEFLEVAFDGLDLVHEPETHIGGDLIVPGPARVQLSTDTANEFGETSLVGGVDVFVIRVNLEGAVLPLLTDLFETSDDNVFFVLAEYARLDEGSGVGLRSTNVLGVHALIVGERLVVGEKERVIFAGEAAAPKLALGEIVGGRSHWVVWSLRR